MVILFGLIKNFLFLNIMELRSRRFKILSSIGQLKIEKVPKSVFGSTASSFDLRSKIFAHLRFKLFETELFCKTQKNFW